MGGAKLPTMELLYQLSYNGVLYTMTLMTPATCFGIEMVHLKAFRGDSSLRLADFVSFAEDLFITINGPMTEKEKFG